MKKRSSFMPRILLGCLGISFVIVRNILTCSEFSYLFKLFLIYYWKKYSNKNNNREIQTTTSDGGTETKKTAKSATYNSLAQSMSSKYDKIKPREFHKNWLDALFGIHILLEFEAKHDRAPIAHDSTDLEKLMTMRVEYFKRRGITDTKRCEESLLSDLQTYYASKSELSPICAVVGGLLAQDILKVLGGKDLPVKNWFVLDGRDLKGMVHDV